MESNIYLLYSKRNDYLLKLQKDITPLFLEGVFSIYNNVKKANKVKKYLLKEFQQSMADVSRWSQEIVDTEHLRFKKRVEIVDKLIKAIFDLDIVTRKDLSNDAKEHVPKPKEFIHQCYLNIARSLWKQPFLMYDVNVDPITCQKNNMKIEKIVAMCIKDTFLNFLPLDDVSMSLTTAVEHGIVTNGDMQPTSFSPIGSLESPNIDVPLQQINEKKSMKHEPSNVEVSSVENVLDEYIEGTDEQRVANIETTTYSEDETESVEDHEELENEEETCYEAIRDDEDIEGDLDEIDNVEIDEDGEDSEDCEDGEDGDQDDQDDQDDQGSQVQVIKQDCSPLHGNGLANNAEQPEGIDNDYMDSEIEENDERDERNDKDVKKINLILEPNTNFSSKINIDDVATSNGSSDIKNVYIGEQLNEYVQPTTSFEVDAGKQENIKVVNIDDKVDKMKSLLSLKKKVKSSLIDGHRTRDRRSNMSFF